MKAGVSSVMRVAVLVSTVTACTVVGSDGGSDGGASTPASPAATEHDGGAGSSDAAADAAPAASTTPQELAGTSWTWTTSSGAHKLTFAAGGRYASDVFLDGHPGDGCGTEYFTHREGEASFRGTTLTLASTLSTRTKKDSCAGKVLAEDAIEQDVTSYAWRLERDDDGVRSLVLTSDDGTERSFLRD